MPFVRSYKIQNYKNLTGPHKKEGAIASHEEEVEGVEMYTEAAKVADEEGFADIADVFRAIPTRLFLFAIVLVVNNFRDNYPIVVLCLVPAYGVIFKITIFRRFCQISGKK